MSFHSHELCTVHVTPLLTRTAHHKLTAHPFHTIVFARLIAAAKASAVFGPTSMPYTRPATDSTQIATDTDICRMTTAEKN